jgi:hypothetical protein
MTESIPIPASTARTLALTAFDDVGRLENEGLTGLSRSLENSAENVLQVATENKGGNFVSIPRRDASRVTAYGNVDASRSARVFLEQYGVWGNK